MNPNSLLDSKEIKSLFHIVIKISNTQISILSSWYTNNNMKTGSPLWANFEKHLTALAYQGNSLFFLSFLSIYFQILKQIKLEDVEGTVE